MPHPRTGSLKVSHIALIALLVAHIAAADESKVRASLVAENDALVPGKTAQIALRLAHAPHWHTYWLNPGDSGQATKLSWTLPEGVAVRATRWPAPKRFDAGGGIVNFVYEGETWVLVELDVPATLEAKPVHLALRAKWLECTVDICVPGGADLALEVPVAKTAAPRRELAAAFEEARARIPQPLKISASGGVFGTSAQFVLPEPGLPPGSAFDAFVLQPAIVESAAPRIVRNELGLYIMTRPSDYLTVVPPSATLVITQPTARGPRAWQVDVPLLTVPTAPGEPR